MAKKDYVRYINSLLNENTEQSKQELSDLFADEEFRRNGYKVVVPYMDKSWCIHDDGFLNLSRYDEFRDIFLKEYK